MNYVNKHLLEFSTTTQVSSMLQIPYIFLVFGYNIEKNLSFEVQSYT